MPKHDQVSSNSTAQKLKFSVNTNTYEMINSTIFAFSSLVLTLLATQDKCFAFELPSEEKYKAGEKSLQDFQTKAKNSACWREAISNLEVGCKKLTDIEQSHLAVEFTNCHMKKSGRRTYNCSRDRSIEDCTRNMDDLAFNAYTTFFTHTTNICFYLQSQAWQERTEDTVSKLSKTSQEVAGQLENSMRNQMIVLQRQNQSLKNQKEIIQHEQKLSLTLKSSTSEAKQAFDEMKTKANEQKAIFSETFEGIFQSVENIKKLQAMILGEFITLQSLAFHFVAVCVCYFFTSCPRTSSARLGLFVGLAALIATERIVSTSSIGAGESANTELVHSRLWLCRKFYIMAATIGLIITAYRYQDLNKINHCLLQEIQKQISDLKEFQAVETSSNMKAIMDREQRNTSLSISHSWAGNIHHCSGALEQTSDTVDSPCNNMDESSYDNTYIPDDTLVDSLSESESDYESICSESVNVISDSFLNELKLGSPLTNSSPRSSERFSSTPRQSKTTLKASRQSMGTPSHSYNLRPRRINQSSQYSNQSFLNMPSPSTLQELVETLKQSTTKYTAVKTKKRRNSGEELFSSDDE